MSQPYAVKIFDVVITHLGVFSNTIISAYDEAGNSYELYGGKVLVGGREVSKEALIAWFLAKPRPNVNATVTIDPNRYSQLVSIDFREKE